ncbi:GTPase Era [Putridiphycobacter roseus]|uniref:GTPase Era n=1 Tax=Putridiphycobacter roseus TaxID=2219161 RepID=A0A2W1MXL0_9FLAO|nr:GTPase Era [Putridiphycobacter roseus]PZE16114.1 GTPase Era [Putridiphycobacter roseus]
MSHKSGFVNIIGSPNVGKSTLMNRLVGEKLSIITSKAQTTRHRILGIVNEEDYQIVFSDTPGVLDAHYKLHENMMKFVNSALKDADVLLVMTDIFEETMNHKETLARIQKTSIPVIVLINKIDLGDQTKLEAKVAQWAEILPNAQILPISALENFNVDLIWEKIIALIPENPPYYDKDQLTDKPLRFFISEIIREKIFEQYKKEIPYSTQVEIEEYKEELKIVRIRAIIYVERKTQKGIIIGHQGQKLKYVGIDARKDIEQFIGKQVFLEMFVKVDENWRGNDNKLEKHGY